MKVCPSCNTEYEDSIKFCLEDGTRTVDKEQKSKDALIGQFIDKDRHFQVVSMLGEGGMGKVYKGRQEAVGRDVAIKTLHKELLDNEQVAKRFQREARAASKLRHQNAIEIFAFGQVEAPSQPYHLMPYMVMEFVAGKSLYKTIQESGKLDEARTIHIMLQVCDVLEEAHAQGIIHRDLKPENIVLTERGRNKDFAKVLDFGIAKLLQEEEAGGTKLTKAGTVFGTPEYLSPEQASGTTVDHRSDIYSLGIILYEMLSGKVPFQADTAVGLLIKHVNEAPKPLRQFAPQAGISESMERVVMKALEKDPAARQQSVADLSDALRAIQSGRGRAAAPAVMPATMVPGGPPPGMKPAAPLPATMVPSGPPPGMRGPSTTNPPVLPATMMPGGPPPGMKPAAPAAPSAPSTGPRTLDPMVVTQPVAPQKSGGSNTGVWAAVALAVLLGGGGAGSYFLYFKNHPEIFGGQPVAQVAQPAPSAASPAVAVEAGSVPAPTPAAPQQVMLQFDSSPRGAEVFLNGALVGLTPAQYPVPASTTPIKIQVRKEGFLPFVQEVIPSPSLPAIAAKLEPDPAAASTTAAKPSEPVPSNPAGTSAVKPSNPAPSGGTSVAKPSGATDATGIKATPPKPPEEKPERPPKPTGPSSEEIKQKKKDKVVDLLNKRGLGGE